MWLFFWCVSDSGHLGQQQGEDASVARKDLEDSSKIIKTLERQVQCVTLEKDSLHKVQIIFRMERFAASSGILNSSLA